MNDVVTCSLGGAELATRRERWKQLSARAGDRIAPTDHGLRLSFRAGAGVDDELHALAALERECCAFAGWAVHRDREQVVLEITASGPEAIAAVQAIFGDLRSNASAAL